MARIFVALYNFGRKKDDFDAMPPFYESFINGLKDAGNEVLCFHQKTFTRSFDGTIPPEEERIIKRFDPQLCILFCNKFWDISSVVDCPIIIYDVDSPLEYAGQEHLKSNIDRYKFVINQSKGFELLHDLYDVKKENIELIPFFTEVRADETVQPNKNISFLGANWLWHGYNFVTSYIKNNPSFDDRVNAKRIIDKFTEYPFADIDQLKEKLRLTKGDSSFDFADPHRAGFEISGLRRLKYLSAISDLGLEIRGSFWNIECMNYFPEIEMCYQSQPTLTKAENEEFYNSSRISFNTKHIQAQNGFSFRVCDVMASNACLVSEKCDDLLRLFPEVKIPMFTTPQEAREQCVKLLKNEDLRLEIVGRAHEAIDKNHRFKNVLEGLEYISGMNLHCDNWGSLTLYSDEDPQSYHEVLDKYIHKFNGVDNNVYLTDFNEYIELNLSDSGSKKDVKKPSRSVGSVFKQFIKRAHYYIFSTSLLGMRKISDNKSNFYIFYLPIFTKRKTKKYTSYNLWIFDTMWCFVADILRKVKRFFSTTEKISADNQMKVVTRLGKKKYFVLKDKYDELFVTLEYINQVMKNSDKELQALLEEKNIPEKEMTKERYEKVKSDVEVYLDKFNASDLPQATGAIRERQLELLELMVQVRNILENAGLHPILAGGNLLGAVRHGGFIPWDDDIDFDIIRSEYEAVIPVLKEHYKFCDVSACKSWPEYFKMINAALKESCGQIVFTKSYSGIKVYSGDTVKTALCLDIFPIDCVSSKVTDDMYKEFWIQAKTSLFKKCKNWGEAFDKMDDIVQNSGIFAPISDRFYYGLGDHAFWNFKYSGLRNFDILYPYTKITFEGEEFYAPHDIDKFLKALYGDYKKIPSKIEISEHLKTAERFLLK